MNKIKKIIFDIETNINAKPSKWIFGIIIFCVLSIIL